MGILNVILKVARELYFDAEQFHQLMTQLNNQTNFVAEEKTGLE